MSFVILKLSILVSLIIPYQTKLNVVLCLLNYWFDLYLKQVAKEGIPLPPDRTICPLCSQKRANPSVVTVSGFVFCYACIFKYVSQVRSLDSYS